MPYYEFTGRATVSVIYKGYLIAADNEDIALDRYFALVDSGSIPIETLYDPRDTEPWMHDISNERPLSEIQLELTLQNNRELK